MIIPRRLYHNEARNKICEEGDPEAAFLIRGALQEISALEANALGLTAYLEQYPERPRPMAVAEESVEAKAVDQGETENKGVAAEETEHRGVSFPAETRRVGRPPRSPSG